MMLTTTGPAQHLDKVLYLLYPWHTTIYHVITPRYPHPVRKVLQLPGSRRLQLFDKGDTARAVVIIK
jgi:hypothetical protein